MRIRAGLAAALIALAAPPALGGEIVDQAARAEALLAEGKAEEALEALDAAVARVWAATPLSFRKALPVTSADGFGMYEPRPDAAYRAGETVRVYAEPIGYGFGTSGDGFVIALDADLAIENARGQVIAEGKDLFSIALPTREKNREFNMTLSFDLPELKAGDYVGVFTVRDRNSDKTGTFRLPLTVTDGEAGAVGAAAPASGGAAPAVGETASGAASDAPVAGTDGEPVSVMNGDAPAAATDR